ncbi:MAG TPA: hypothetical protein VFH51_09095, partial [Myxococcota bacterium]|nr:hypothetical protein [Myxococcota bacterium]
VGYVQRSTGRRRRIMVTTFLITVSLVTVMAAVMPRIYKISTRILTHKSTMDVIVNGKTALPPSANSPTAGAIELIKSRENLENLMTDVKLQEVWDAKRSWVGKFKDKALALVFGPPTEADIHEAYLKMLDEKIDAGVEGEVVVMEVEWPDPDVAMSLAEGIVARFLKMRHDMELSEVLESVNILERNVESSRMTVEDAIKRMQKVFDVKESELASRSGQSTKEVRKPKRNRFVAIRKPMGAEQVDAGTDDIKRQLAEKQAALSTVKRGYDARVKKAEQDLARLRGELGPDHPDVIEARRNLEGHQAMPPELQALEAEVNRLAGSLGSIPAPTPKEEPKVQVSTGASQDDSFDMMRVPVSDDLYQQIDNDPEIASIMDELKKRQDAHDGLVQRLAEARISAEVANVAFEYRYIMTGPPVYPKKPVKPNVPVMLGGGAVAALILGIVFALLADVVSQRILEAWQLERFLKLKVFGEIEDP